MSVFLCDPSDSTPTKSDKPPDKDHGKQLLEANDHSASEWVWQSEFQHVVGA